MPNFNPSFIDSQMLARFGNLTASSNNEVLVSGRPYTEPASQAQRSVVSTSVQDKAGGSGAVAVRITFLNSNYVLKTEDVVLNGTTAVDMVATDLRFVEDMRVIQGSSAVGAIKLMTTTGGGGTEITGIGAATENAFLCHHYVPVGKQAYVIAWEASIDDECSMKLQGQHWYNGNLVIENWDLRKMFGIATPPGRIEGFWNMPVCPMDEKTRVWVTAAPNQNTSTVIRTHLYIWEE